MGNAIIFLEPSRPIEDSMTPTNSPAPSIIPASVISLSRDAASVPPTLRSGHPPVHGHPYGLPCNWVDYYEEPRPTLLAMAPERRVLPGFPVDGLAEVADRVFGAVEMATDARLASARLRGLRSMRLPEDSRVERVDEGKVVSGRDGTLWFKQSTFGEPAVARAKATRVLAGVRTLKRVYENVLVQKRESRIWGIVNNCLLALLGAVAAAGTILAILGLTLSGPVGWATLGLGTALALSKAIEGARENNQPALLNDIEKSRLEQLQELVRSECADHASSGHRVTSIRFEAEEYPKTATQLVSEVLNAGTEREGDEWFDAARAFGEFGAERLLHPWQG